MNKSKDSRRGISFVKRVYPARTLGMGMGALAIAAVLYTHQVHWGYWVLLVLGGFVWPHIAYLVAVRSKTPFLAEHRHLLFDSAISGFWVAAMGFSPLTSCMVIMMVWMDNIAAGGAKLFIRSVGTSVFGLATGLLLIGFHPRLEMTDLIIYACLPVLITCPLAIGSITYRLAMQLHKQKELLQQLSRTDGLTGLFNRHYWESRVNDLIAQARRHPQPMSMVLLDVDHFKSINDTHGHSVGDLVLQQISRQLQTNLRGAELLGRYGGEEFALLLPNTSSEAAAATAERLRHVIAQACFCEQDLEHQQALRCTISLGVASWESGFTDYADWFRAADNALYEAKHRGRNTTVVHTMSHGEKVA